MATFFVTNEAELVMAITLANGNGQPDMINILMNIDITGTLPTMTPDSGNLLTINGGGFTVSRTSGIGGIFVVTGVVSINNLTLSHVAGVAIQSPVLNLGDLTLNGCTLSGNTTSDAGGAIRNAANNLTLNNCVFANNTTISGFNGGAIQNNGTSCIVNGCTISGNTAAGAGGGLRTSTGTLIVTNSTFSGNTCNSATGGGGISISGTTASFTNCTIASNAANNISGGGGGINRVSGTLNLINTIISNNTTMATGATPGPDILAVVSGTPLNNLIGIGDGGLTGLVDSVNGNQVGTVALPIDPMLGMLQNNGGPTPTRAIGCTGPARDAGTNTVTGPPLNMTADQRGGSFARQVGANVDIGAFEIQPTPAMPSAIMGPSSVCPGTTGVVYSVVNDPTVVSYTWMYSGTGTTFSSTTSSVTIDFSPGVTGGILSVTANGDCSSSTQTLEITAACPPSIALMVADTTNHRIQGFDGNTWLVVGVGTVGNGNGQFRLPEAVTFDGAGRIYVADTGNNRIQWSTDGGTTWANFATIGSGLNQVRAPQGLALDSGGTLYVSDTGNGRVMRFNGGIPGTGVVIATNGTASGQVGSPRGLAVDATFRLFVTDESNNRILRILNANTTVSATSGTVLASSGTGMNQVKNPQGITIDAAGTVFVADTGNSRILRWTNANPASATTMALTGSQLGQVNRPEGVTISQFLSGPFVGTPVLIVGDTGNNRIQGRFLPTGSWTLIGAPNGLGTGVGQFRAPSKIR